MSEIRTFEDVLADMRDVVKIERLDDTVRVPVSDLALILAHIAEVERKAKAEAWDEGVLLLASVQDIVVGPDWLRLTNPYRQEGDR